MLAKIWNKIKAGWAWFEAKVDAAAPKLKVKIVAMFGLISNGALVAQEFVQGIPAGIFNARNIMIANGVFFILIFWLRRIGNRVASR